MDKERLIKELDKIVSLYDELGEVTNKINGQFTSCEEIVVCDNLFHNTEVQLFNNAKGIAEMLNIKYQIEDREARCYNKMISFVYKGVKFFEIYGEENNND